MRRKPVQQLCFDVGGIFFADEKHAVDGGGDADICGSECVVTKKRLAGLFAAESVDRPVSVGIRGGIGGVFNGDADSGHAVAGGVDDATIDGVWFGGGVFFGAGTKKK